MQKILISIKPEWVEKILNGEKTIEIRKSIPKCNLPCEVYIYCTKAKPNLYIPYEFSAFPEDETSQPYFADSPIFDGLDHQANGKVVAKFTLKNVDDTSFYKLCVHNTSEKLKLLLNKAQLTKEQLYRYAPNHKIALWHIENLQIYDEPFELKWFGIEKAPQSWCYIKGNSYASNETC